MVFVLSSRKEPQNPVHPAVARKLLTAGQAAVFRHAPFTIILKSEEPEALRPLRLKIDPGSKVTGLALIEEHSHRVVFIAELRHRGQAVRDALLHRRALRRSRRSRKTRYRAPRFLNRRRRSGWLPPSLESRIANVMTWVRRLRRLTPVQALSIESVKFDTQLLEHPEIHGVEYQQGTLQGYDVKEYLLEKWSRHCAYCGKGGQPLQIEHIVPKIRGGSDRVGNLALACRPCNQEKGNRTAAEYGHPEVQRRAKRPLKDAAAINATRRALVARLREDGLPVEQATGGETKYNRTRLGLPKAHWVDAACVGQTGAAILVPKTMALLTIISTGHGTRQMCGTDRYGFPIRYRGHQRTHRGFRTGDLVVAQVPRGKYAGCHHGRVLVRASGRFDIRTLHGRIQGVAARCCQRLQGRDGYEYTNAMTGINDQPSAADSTPAASGLADAQHSPEREADPPPLRGKAHLLGDRYRPPDPDGGRPLLPLEPTRRGPRRDRGPAVALDPPPDGLGARRVVGPP